MLANADIPHKMIAEGKTEAKDTKFNTGIRGHNNRDQISVDAERLPILWHEMAWCGIDGWLERRADLDNKAGKDREAWKMKFSTKNPVSPYDRVVPARALIIVKVDGVLHNFNLSYDTVSVEGSPSVNGMVLMDMAKARDHVDTSSLKPTVWFQSPANVSGPRFMLKLEKMKEFNAWTCKDDVSGRIYPYTITAAYVFKKKSA